MADAAYKTPAEIKDYAIDWSQVLIDGDRIAVSGDSTWSASGPDSSLTVDTPSPSIASDGLSATVWLAGGTPSQIYIVTNTIITEGGREYQESFPCYISAHNYL